MPTITAIRSRIRESRDAHAARSALERELASYSSPSDLDDLHAILDRYNDRETMEIRRILATQGTGSERRRRCGGDDSRASLTTCSPAASAASIHGPHAPGYNRNDAALMRL